MTGDVAVGDVWQHRTTGNRVAILNVSQLADDDRVIVVDITDADQGLAGNITAMARWDLMVDWDWCDYTWSV